MTTRWSLVQAAGRDSPEAKEALGTLCTTYWYPLYAFVRRHGHNPDEAQDLTQEFFARLLEKHSLEMVDPGKGKFRSFLLAAMQHFLANERDRVLAQKRGGDRRFLSIDVAAAENRYRLEPSHQLTAEKLFERRWVLTLLDQVLVRLREEMLLAGKNHLFDRLKVFLTGEKKSVSHAQVAEQLGMTEGAVKVAVHRLRRRYRELLRNAIGETLNDPEHIDEEIRDLFNALGS